MQFKLGMIHDPDLTEFPDSFCGLLQLKHLEAQSNNLTLLPDNINSLVNLERLLLGNNQLTTLPYSFFQLNKLTELCLCQNPLDFSQFTPEQLQFIEQREVHNRYISIK